jgi:hypothetical protein
MDMMAGANFYILILWDTIAFSVISVMRWKIQKIQQSID